MPKQVGGSVYGLRSLQYLTISLLTHQTTCFKYPCILDFQFHLLLSLEVTGGGQLDKVLERRMLRAGKSQGWGRSFVSSFLTAPGLALLLLLIYGLSQHNHI